MTLEQATQSLNGLSVQTLDKWGLHLTAAIVPAKADDAQRYYDEVFKSRTIMPDAGAAYSSDGTYSLAWLNVGYTRTYHLPIDNDVPLPIAS